MGGESGKRIYRDAAAASQRPRVRAAPPSSVASVPTGPAVPAWEAEMVAILDAPLVPGETIETAYRAKEQAMLVLFARLGVADALALHRRLLAGAAGDALAVRFARMTSERRIRLLAFLADVRRREARAGRR